MAKSKNTSWDSEENEVKVPFVSWGKPGDFIHGTVVGIRKVKSTLADKAGQIQNIYDFKVKECEYHKLDNKKNPVDELTVHEEGDLVSVGGRDSLESRMKTIKVGQIVALKFIEEFPSKTKSFSPSKFIKVYFPKNSDGTYETDQEFLDSQADEMNQFDSKK